jgi:hypothetical protein
MVVQLRAYRAGLPPFNQACTGGQTIWGVRAWWTSLNSEDTSNIVNLAILLLDVVPHAAAPERVFSMLGWYQSKFRNRLSVTTTGMMAVTRQHLQEMYTAGRIQQRTRKRVRSAEETSVPNGATAEDAVDLDESDAEQDDIASEEAAEALIEVLTEENGGGAAGAAALNLDLLVELWTDNGITVDSELLNPFVEVRGTAPPAPLGGMGSGGAVPPGNVDVAALIAAAMHGDS